MDINTLIQQNSSKVGNLLRRYHVAGPPDMDTIKLAYDKHGQGFMMKLLAILSQDSTSNFTGIGATLENPLVNQAFEVQAAQEQSGKFWQFWNNLLTGVTKTGQAIGEFKENVNGSVNNQEYLAYQAAQKNNSRIVFAIAGFMVILILLILLFRKK